MKLIRNLAISAVAAMTAMGGQALADGKFQANLARPALPQDAGYDRDGDSVNDTPNLPWCTNQGAVGQGVCFLGTSDGATCNINDPSSLCISNGGSCVQPYDGVTIADAKRGRCQNAPTTRCFDDSDCGMNPCIPMAPDVKKSKCQVNGTKIKGSFALPKDLSGNPVPNVPDTIPAGTCSESSSNANNPCTKHTDCPGGFCLSGDEFWLQVQAQIGINKDNLPPCDPSCVVGAQLCLLGNCLDGSPCTTSANCDRACFIGTCSGGAEHGAPCEPTGQLLTTCAGGGICLASLGSPGMPGPGDDVTNDEIKLNVNTSVGTVIATVYCPVVASFSIPGEMKKGTAKFGADLLTTLNVGVDPSLPVNHIQCHVHDQALSVQELPEKLVIGAVVDGANTGSCHKEICPSTLTISDLGVLTPVSPILASTGETAGNISKCDAIGDPCCPGGACVAPLACNTTTNTCQ